MSEYNSVSDLIYGLEESEFEHMVLDGLLDGETPVKVYVAIAPNGSGAVIPLAILLTQDLFRRVTPANDLLSRETDEEFEERMKSYGVGGDAA